MREQRQRNSSGFPSEPGISHKNQTATPRGTGTETETGEREVVRANNRHINNIRIYFVDVQANPSIGTQTHASIARYVATILEIHGKI